MCIDDLKRNKKEKNMVKLDYLENKAIAVLGAGNVGKAIASDCALSGNKVSLCDINPFAPKTLFGAKEKRVKLYGSN